ncbi:hypothetical protein D3C85_1525570 [compost metagenome]
MEGTSLTTLDDALPGAGAEDELHPDSKAASRAADVSQRGSIYTDFGAEPLIIIKNSILSW